MAAIKVRVGQSDAVKVISSQGGGSISAQNATSVVMSVNITPTSATNKLLIKAVVHMSSSSASNSIGFNFTKDGSEQILNPSSVGNRIKCTGVGGNE